MKKLAFALAFSAMASGAQAATILFNFAAVGHQDNLGPTETYTASGLSIIASGFSFATTPATPAAIDLWGKHAGAGETGLGLANDPQHEIKYHMGFVQLDLAGLFGHVAPGTTFFGTNSTTQGETWTVYGTNTAGTTVGAVQLTSGTNDGNHLLPSLGTYRYYDFVSTANLGGKNYLITSLTTTTVPEPATWTIMLLGFGGMGAVLRRRRTRLGLTAA